MKTQLDQYRDKTTDQLRYIAKDAHAAAMAMHGINSGAESKYLDQVNDACTVMFERARADRRAAREGTI
jgi:hypothetical protein